jgi:hypothetical protein
MDPDFRAGVAPGAARLAAGGATDFRGAPAPPLFFAEGPLPLAAFPEARPPEVERTVPLEDTPALAAGFPDVGWREGERCADFLRFWFLASAAIRILPGRMLQNTAARGPDRAKPALPGTQPKLSEFAS